MKRKYQPFILSAFISLPMCLLLSFIGTISNFGFREGWFVIWAKSFVLNFPVAYFCALVFSALARRITSNMKWVD
jgi:hypothetical protein